MNEKIYQNSSINKLMKSNEPTKQLITLEHTLKVINLLQKITFNPT